MTICIHCQIDTLGTDEQTLRACYAVAASMRTSTNDLCVKHRESLIFAAQALTMLQAVAPPTPALTTGLPMTTGHPATATGPRPKLTLVKVEHAPAPGLHAPEDRPNGVNAEPLPHWPDRCGHTRPRDRFLGTVDIEDVPHDVFVYQNNAFVASPDMHICVRYGRKAHQYISPGNVDYFIACCTTEQWRFLLSKPPTTYLAIKPLIDKWIANGRP